MSVDPLESTTKLDEFGAREGCVAMALDHSHAFIVAGNTNQYGPPNFAVLDLQSPGRSTTIASMKLDIGRRESHVAIAVHDKHVFVAAGRPRKPLLGSALKTPSFVVVDVQNPAKPKQVASLQLDFGSDYSGVTMILQGGHAFLASGDIQSSDSYNFTVLDIQDPTKPTHVASTKVEFGGGHAGVAMVLQGQHAFLATGLLSGQTFTAGTDSPNFAVIDIQHPAAPAQVASMRVQFGTSESHVAMALQGTHVYLAAGDTNRLGPPNFVVLNIQSATAPAQVASMKLSFGDREGGAAMVLHGTHVYLAAGDTNRLGPPNVAVLDVQNPSTPAQVATMKLNFGAREGGVAMAMHGTHAFLLAGDTNRVGPPNWVVLDLASNPASWDHEYTSSACPCM